MYAGDVITSINILCPSLLYKLTTSTVEPALIIYYRVWVELKEIQMRVEMSALHVKKSFRKCVENSLIF